MTDGGPERVALAAAGLVAAAIAVLVAGAVREGGSAARAEAFHRMTGGLGSGPATALAPCDAAFDAGVAGRCAAGFDTVPGGGAFCIHHSGPSLGR